MGLFYGSNLFLYINILNVETFYRTPVKIFDVKGLESFWSFLECVKNLRQTHVF